MFEISQTKRSFPFGQIVIVLFLTFVIASWALSDSPTSKPCDVCEGVIPDIAVIACGFVLMLGVCGYVDVETAKVEVQANKCCECGCVSGRDLPVKLKE